MRAEAYPNACKLCKEAHDYEQLKNVASLGSLNDKLDAAKFLEAQDTQDCRDKALQLYSMAGQGLKVGVAETLLLTMNDALHYSFDT